MWFVLISCYWVCASYSQLIQNGFLPPTKIVTHFTSRFPEGHAGILGFSLPSAGKSKVIIYVKFLQSLWLLSLGSLRSMLFNHPWVGSNHFEFPPFVHSLSKWGSLESKLFTDAFVIFSSLMSSNKPLSELLGNLRCSSGSKLSKTSKLAANSREIHSSVRSISFAFSLSYEIQSYNHLCFMGFVVFARMNSFLLLIFPLIKKNGKTQLYKTFSF